MATVEDSLTGLVSDVRHHATRMAARGGGGRVRVQWHRGRAARGERVALRAADGYPLAAVRYTPTGAVRANLIVAGATAPVLTGVSGYLSWSRLRMGEDLPRDFYRQWKHWCRFPNFFFGDPAMQPVAQAFAGVRTRIMAANATDDRWSPPASRDAFIAGYRNAARQTLDIDPARVRLPAIGHMGDFRTGAVSLWESALEWLDRPNG
ncbi:MAG: hypothetical protein R2708_29030 [Vicinamibacterales bacterium]